MLSLLNNSFNSRPRLGIPLLGQGKLAFDQQGQVGSDPLAEHADQPIPSGAFRASLVNVGGGQMASRGQTSGETLQSFPSLVLGPYTLV